MRKKVTLSKTLIQPLKVSWARVVTRVFYRFSSRVEEGNIICMSGVAGEKPWYEVCMHSWCGMKLGLYKALAEELHSEVQLITRNVGIVEEIEQVWRLDLCGRSFYLKGTMAYYLILNQSSYYIDSIASFFHLRLFDTLLEPNIVI